MLNFKSTAEKILRVNTCSLILYLCTIIRPSETTAANAWQQSFAAGCKDSTGKYAGGSEIMHICPHKGKLYAFNGYWKDKHYPEQSAQVLRLDAPGGKWEVDLETSGSGLVHMKGNILKSITFKTDKHGNPVNVTLLAAASQTHVAPGTNAVSVFIRNDQTGAWHHSILQQGPSAGTRRVPRDMEIYHDPVTGVDRIFLLIGNPGIISGVYNESTQNIEWDNLPEHPPDGTKFPARPLGITEANGNLYFSVGGRIFKRTNGQSPVWTLAYEIAGRVNTDVGGIRGLSTIPHPNGDGESLIFVWTPNGRSKGTIKRLDGINLADHNETSLAELFNNENISGNASVRFSLGGYNRFFPVKKTGSGEIFHLIGFEQRIKGSDDSVKWNKYYRGAMFAIRSRQGQYRVREVNGKYSASKPTLIAPRAFAQSPFPGEENIIYIGGFDANGFDATDKAWIFKVDINEELKDIE